MALRLDPIRLVLLRLDSSVRSTVYDADGMSTCMPRFCCARDDSASILRKMPPVLAVHGGSDRRAFSSFSAATTRHYGINGTSVSPMRRSPRSRLRRKPFPRAQKLNSEFALARFAKKFRIPSSLFNP